MNIFTEAAPQPSCEPSSWILCNRWPLPPNAPPFVIVPTTSLYRKFANRTIPPEPNSVLVVEIGCCNGFCTQKIVNRVHAPADQVLGMDVGPQFIRECQAKFPNVQFEFINVLMEWNRAKTLIEEKLEKLQQQGGTNKTPELYVYVDIGGNREMESLLPLLQTVQTQLKPSSLIIKSKALFALGQEHDLATLEAWTDMQSLAQKALLKRRQVESSSETSNKETKQVATKARIYRPLKMPQRCNSSGIAICRFHNYDRKNGCKVHQDTNHLGKSCPLDHEHCHVCLGVGHVAWQCQSTESLVDGLLQ